MKSESQQAALLAHRGRSLLIRQRTSLINAIHSHFAEFGFVAAKGPANIAKLTKVIRDEQQSAIPLETRAALLILLDQLKSLDAAIAAMEKKQSLSGDQMIG